MNVRPDNTTVIPTPTVPTSKDHLIVRVNQVIKEMAHFAQVRNIHEYRCSKGTVTRCNFSCNLQRNSTLKRC